MKTFSEQSQVFFLLEMKTLKYHDPKEFDDSDEDWDDLESSDDEDDL